MLRNTNESKVTESPPEKKTQLTALETHVKFFSNGSGKFTAESIEQGMKKLGGTSAEKAHSTSLLTMNAASRKGCPYAKFFGGGHFESAEIPKLIHPADTGIFTKKGEFNSELFSQLEKYATEDKESGQKVISIAKLNEFKQKESHQERWADANFFSKKVSETASNSEFDLLFELLSDYKKNGVNYISIPRLHRFYTDGETLFKELVEKNNRFTPK